jgi:hypothetical protein
MKRYLIALIVALALAGSAHADSQHCYKGNSDSTTICEFSPSGRVNVTSVYDNGEYFSHWYSRAEWLRYKSNRNSIDVYQKPTNTKSETEARSWHSQAGCERDGFAWRDGACHGN